MTVKGGNSLQLSHSSRPFVNETRFVVGVVGSAL